MTPKRNSTYRIASSTITLDKNIQGHTAKKFPCPTCGKKAFVRYWNTSTSSYLPDEFGRCDREENCGTYNQPWEWLKTNRTDQNLPLVPRGMQKASVPPPSGPVIKAVDRDTVKRTLTAYDRNTLIIFLKTLATPEQVDAVLSKLFIGTAKDGSAIFWLVDKAMRTRTGQKVRYQPDGHRDKAFGAIRLFMNKDGYTPCLFGEHQLWTSPNADTLTIAIVESEKTAAICTLYLPELNGAPVIWMACSGVNGLTDDKIRCLTGRSIILVPDFSFHARATWGLVPMRKITRFTRNELGKVIKTRVPHPAGQLETEYLSAAAKLRAIACTVGFHNPFPDVTDSSDIADHLVRKPLGAAPSYRNKPYWTSLDTLLKSCQFAIDHGYELKPYKGHGGQKRSQTHRSAPSGSFLPMSGVLIPLEGEAGFKVSQNGKVYCDHPTASKALEPFMGNPHYLKLLALCGNEGTISPNYSTEMI